MVTESTSKSSQQQSVQKVVPQPRKSVLVLLHADGFVEVYSDKEAVDARILCVPQMTTFAGEILAEKYIETMLTNRYRDVFYPSNRIALGNHTTITPELIAKRNDELKQSRVLDEIAAKMANLKNGEQKKNALQNCGASSVDDAASLLSTTTNAIGGIGCSKAVAS